MTKNLVCFGVPINGRYYDIDSCDWIELIERSKNGTVLGEFDHDFNSVEVQLKNISHVVQNIEIYDDGIWGDIKLIDTQNGKILKELIDSGIPIDFSVRSVGQVDSNGKIINAKIISVDAINTFGINNKIQLRLKKLTKIKKLMNERPI